MLDCQEVNAYYILDISPCRKSLCVCETRELDSSSVTCSREKSLEGMYSIRKVGIHCKFNLADQLAKKSIYEQGPG